jgi:LytS/YehU family sensor histidine kinase
LQTLVENAIKHGIAARPGPGLVEIRAARRDGGLSIEVANQRPMSAAPPTGPGVGLTNARERLRLLFGREATLELDLSDAERAVARVKVPATTQGALA